ACSPSCTTPAMTTPQLPALHRLAWWLPGALTALAAILAVATWRPNEQGLLPMVAILCALPWSLALVPVNFGPGFADHAALIVTAGLFVNAALTWWSTAVLRARCLRRHFADRQEG
ncbi:hypothetical protein QTI66_39435, partial [Variovorax sp. J22R133]|uniref:hypothetical protein n=1 Tax=Variovorax brevis TaxID=3053503 RepID=UPI002574E695